MLKLTIEALWMVTVMDGQQIGSILASNIAAVTTMTTGMGGWLRRLGRRRSFFPALRQAIVREMEDSVLALDDQERIVEANPAAARFARLSLPDLIGQPATQALGQFPDLLALYAKLSAAGGQGEQRGEVTIGKGTPLIGIELILTPLLDSTGQKLGRLLIVHNITRYKQTQAALARRLEEFQILQTMDTEISRSLDVDTVLDTALTAAMQISGADAGLITLVEGSTQRVARIAGQYPPEWLNRHISLTLGIVGRTVQRMEAELVYDVRSDPDYEVARPETRAQMSIPLITHESVVGALNLETADPSRFTQENFEFIKVLAARIAGTIENAQLYSLSLHQVVELKTAYDQIRELHQLRADMLRVASHDLKNPLHILNGYLNLLRDDLASTESVHQEYLSEMGRQSERMGQIIQDILLMERLQEVTLHEPVDFQLIVLMAIDIATPEIESKAQVLDSQIAPDAITVNGDEPQLREAVVNLLGNAIKYTPEGGHITVKLIKSADRVTFEVTDTGYGIPEDRQQRLFQPFYRAKAPGTEDIPGTGLGLHLVKNIVKRHDGELYFHSASGAGSTFGFKLPYVP